MSERPSAKPTVDPTAAATSLDNGISPNPDALMGKVMNESDPGKTELATVKDPSPLENPSGIDHQPAAPVNAIPPSRPMGSITLITLPSDAVTALTPRPMI